MENKIIFLVNVLDCYVEHIEDTCLKYQDKTPYSETTVAAFRLFIDLLNHILNSPDMQDSELMAVLSQMGRGGARG